MIVDRIKELIETYDAEQGIYFVRASVSGGNKHVLVFVDTDESITIQQCAKLSRHLEQYLEEEGVVRDKYKLEVSSPGAFSPMLLERQLPKALNRNVSIKIGSDRFDGLLTKVEGSHLHIQQKKKKEIIEKNFVFDEIDEIAIIPKF